MRLDRPHLHAAVAALCLLGAAAAMPAAAANFTVMTTSSLTFTPADLAITAGDSVTFQNTSQGFHDVHADDGSFRCANGCDGQGGDGNPSTNLWSFTLTFNSPGTIPYHCEIHGAPGLGMHGTITVSSPNGPPATPNELTATPVDSADIALAWTLNSANETDVRVQSRLLDGGSFADLLPLLPAGTDHVTVSGLEPGTAYAFHVRAENGFGDSAFTPEVAATTAVPGGPCVAGAQTLCLLGRRFSVQAAWENQFNGASGRAFAIPSTDSTGFFYFTDPTNFELIVKILNFGDVVKVFYAELTNLRFSITVTDSQTGAVKAYQNTPGDCGAIDEHGFAAAAKRGRRAAIAKSGSCAAGTNTLCLLNRRFAISVNWMNQFNDTSGQGSQRSLSDQSGLFSFTDPTDVELVMKVVDFGDRTAFFYGALSDFAYDIAVTDTVGGTTKTYHNPPGSYCGGLDNSAFPP